MARAPSLYEAVATLERHFGGAFVYAPTRWGTADGTIEYRALFPAMAMVRQQLAGERLHLARAHGLSQPTQGAQRAAQSDERIAHGAA